MNYLENYKKTHQHPVNRALHTVGIPAIVVSLVIIFFNWKVGLGLFVFGWVLQFIGHAFEGKPPAFFSNPVYLFTGVFWWAKKVLGLVPKEEKQN